MKRDFDPQRLYDLLPYGLTVPSHCPDVTKIEILCEGDEAQLVGILENTPFALEDNRFLVGVSDRRNAGRVPLFEVSIILAVRFGEFVGGYPVVVIEDSQRMVFGGREKWGYPKLFADIRMSASADDAEASITIGGERVVAVSWVADEQVGAPDEAPPVLTPHLCLRMLPHADREGVCFADLISRSVGKDFVTKERRYGKGSVAFDDLPEGQIRPGYAGFADGLSALKIKRIVSACRVDGDWFSTEENGWGKVIERFV